MLIDNICLLITSQSREVVNPSISFLHVFIQVQPVMESAKFCEKIVNSLCKMTEDCKRHFRLKTRYVRFFFLNWSLFSQSDKIMLCQVELFNFLWLMWDHYVPSPHTLNDESPGAPWTPHGYPDLTSTA